MEEIFVIVVSTYADDEQLIDWHLEKDFYTNRMKASQKARDLALDWSEQTERELEIGSQVFSKNGAWIALDEDGCRTEFLVSPLNSAE